MVDQKIIGAQVRKMRKAKGMTQEQLAEKAGVGVTHISHIETGRTAPSLDIVICLINAFECSADELLSVEIKKDVTIRNNWLTELVEDCSSLEVKMIAEMVVSLKESMRRLEIEKTDEKNRFRVWKSTAGMCRVFLCLDCMMGAVRRKGEGPMGVRKSTDYSYMFALLDSLLAAELPLIKLYYEIGRVIGARAEKSAVAAAAEYLQNAYPDFAGFSPRNLRRMRAFYQAYAGTPEMIDAAMKIGWTQNVIILETKLTTTEKEWYIRAVRQFGWSKSELLRQIEVEAHLTLDLQGEVCYTVENVAAEEETSHAQAKDHQCHGTGTPGAANGVSAFLPLLHPKLLHRGIHSQPLLVCNERGRPVGVADGTGPPGRRQDVFPKGGTDPPNLAKFI